MVSFVLPLLPHPNIIATTPHTIHHNSFLKEIPDKTTLSQGLNNTCTNSNSTISMDEFSEIMEYAIPLENGNNTGLRQRAWEWIEANNEMKKVRKNVDYKSIIGKAEEYLNRRHGKIILIHYPKNSMVHDKIVFPELSNGILTIRYMRELKNRFYRFAKSVEHNNIPYVMLTLTTRMSPERSVVSDIDLLRKAWNKLRTYLSKEMLHYQGFFAFVELGSKGLMAHMHVIILGMIDLPRNKIKQLWEKYTGAYQVEVSHASVHTARSKGIWYATKYITKSIRMLKNNELPTNLVFMWATGKRMWSASKNVREMMKENHASGRWEAYFISDTFNYKGIYVYEPSNDIFILQKSHAG